MVKLDKNLSVRVNKEVLEKLKKILGLYDDAKAIRGAMNFTVNVTQNLFGGEIGNVFKRRKDNEEVDKYEKII